MASGTSDQDEALRRFLAIPLDQARAAAARGDRFLQIQVPVSALTGQPSSFGSSRNSVQEYGGAADLLGEIEDLGWRLEHAGFVFIETGSTSTSRVLSTGEGTVTEGTVQGIYLFRRVAAPST